MKSSTKRETSPWRAPPGGIKKQRPAPSSVQAIFGNEMFRRNRRPWNGKYDQGMFSKEGKWYLFVNVDQCVRGEDEVCQSETETHPQCSQLRLPRSIIIGLWVLASDLYCSVEYRGREKCENVDLLVVSMIGLSRRRIFWLGSVDDCLPHTLVALSSR